MVWAIDYAAAFAPVAAIESGPIRANGVHVQADGRIRLVLEFSDSTQIATFRGDEPASPEPAPLELLGVVTAGPSVHDCGFSESAAA